MPRSIELVLRDGETLDSALRRFGLKDAKEDILSEKHRIKSVMAPKRYKKSALLDVAIQEVKALPPKRQEAIAEAILADLRQAADPSTMRFQELVEAKYTRGLTPAESLEIEGLEAAFRDSDEVFYGPLIKRAKAKRASAGKRLSL